MPDKLDIEKIIKANPGVDASDFEKALRAIKELRGSGVQSEQYGLEPPFSKRQVSIEESDDPRAIFERD